MINQKGSEKVRMGSWLLKLLSRDMKIKTKNKDQPINNHKNNRKISEKQSNGKYNTCHGAPFQKWIDGRYQSLI